MKQIIVGLLLILCFFQTSYLSASYQRPSSVKKSVWKKVKPYFLPENHPTKSKLDKIFRKNRAVLSSSTMKRAGFISPVPQETTRVVVTKHPKIPGYIIKTHLDAQKARKNKPEEFYWIKRIKGVTAIDHYITKKGWTDCFKVPRKWIYPLPNHPSPPSSFQRVNFILVEEDMYLLDTKNNEAKWGTAVVTHDFLLKYFTILEKIGLGDCAKPDNSPFSIDGKIAFIDTQSYGEWTINYKRLTPYLSPSVKTDWKKLIKGKRK